MSEIDMSWASYSSNGVQYKKENGKWVRDEESMKQLAEYQQAKIDLRNALISRILTDEEMTRVLGLQESLFVENGQPYFTKDKIEIFHLALAQQFKLRVIAKEHQK